GLCELVDNAIDLWVSGGRNGKLQIRLSVDHERQTIVVEDFAGGVAQEDLEHLVSPGSSGNDPYGHSIGIFGVGSKRAVVALAAKVVIKTCKRAGKAFQIEIDDDWLKIPDWEMPLYEIPDIEPGRTIVELSLLRRPLDVSAAGSISLHLGEVYASFLRDGRVSISVNDSPCIAHDFTLWAFPPEYPPRSTMVDLPIEPHGPVAVQITGGLIRDREPGKDNYGVYIYCNDRLVVKELQNHEVGYVTGGAGIPHPEASLCRVIVEFAGPARHMPWNSSKSGINYDHPIFQGVRDLIVEFTSRYSKLSRSLRKRWEDEVFPYKEGEIEIVVSPEPGQIRKVHLPPVPRSRTSHIEGMVAQNERPVERRPWTRGLIESIGLVDVIMKQRAETRSRAALVLLDSTFEIALKEYIVHNDVLSNNVNLKKLFERRDLVIAHIQTEQKIRAEWLEIADHYYKLRCRLIHEKATETPPASDIERYREVVTNILKLLFYLKFD
ncbi:MAG TPA: ATP-binding protein, partial [Fimbriimonas sp.]|nr:ATP-binding protein [Fimbriimonas sp.]